jgi:hypothetical protein
MLLRVQSCSSHAWFVWTVSILSGPMRSLWALGHLPGRQDRKIQCVMRTGGTVYHRVLSALVLTEVAIVVEKASPRYRLTPDDCPRRSWNSNR